jgi:hypothetical protein
MLSLLQLSKLNLLFSKLDLKKYVFYEQVYSVFTFMDLFVFLFLNMMEAFHVKSKNSTINDDIIDVDQHFVLPQQAAAFSLSAKLAGNDH